MRGAATSDPAITVVMNVYDGERDVVESLRSIAAQTHAAFTAIIWDDGSTDATPDLCARFCAADDRFRFVRSEANQGLVAARQQAIDLADGDWIALCDADDLWAPQKLQVQVEAIAAHAADPGPEGLPLVVLGSNGYHINSAGRVRGTFDVGVHDGAAHRAMRDAGEVFHVLNSSAVFRRDVYEAVGGYRADYFPGEDVDLWTRMAREGVVLNLVEPLVSYRVHGGSISDRGLVRQMLNTHRVGTNARRHLRGLPELDHDRHLAELRADPVTFRRLHRGWVAQHLYRRAAGALANGEPGRGAVLMARSALVDPRVPAQRLRRQVLHPASLRRGP